MSQYLRTAPVNMSRILSVSSHYSSLCWWKRAVSEDFCSSDSFRGSHLLCWGTRWFRPSIATSGGKPDKKWPIMYTVVALISKADVITTKSNLSLLDLSLSACLQGWVVDWRISHYAIYSHTGMTFHTSQILQHIKNFLAHLQGRLNTSQFNFSTLDFLLRKRCLVCFHSVWACQWMVCVPVQQ